MVSFANLIAFANYLLVLMILFHVSAHIRDSTGAWFTFNDQMVQAEGKKLKLNAEQNDGL